MPARRTPRGEERRERILRAALLVIGERGVAGATHRAVATRAGVPTATTTYYFATLDELLEDALRLFVGEEVAALQAATAELVSAGDIAPDAVADLVESILVHSDRDRVVVAVAQFDLYVEASRRPALREAAGECIAAYEAFAAAALDALGVPDAEGLAPVFVALADGLGLQRVARGENHPRQLPLREALLRLLGAATAVRQ